MKASAGKMPEIDAIINNPAAPTFENTIVPYEKSGELLHRVTTVFGNLLSAETSNELQELPGNHATDERT